MRTVTVLPSQSLLDICVQEMGSIEFLFDLMEANNLTSFDLIPPDSLFIPEVAIKKNVVSFFTGNNIKPASISEAVESLISNDFDDDDFDPDDFG